MSMGCFINEEAEQEFYSLCWIYFDSLLSFFSEFLNEEEQFKKVMDYQERHPDMDLRESLTVYAFKYADKNRLDFNRVWNSLSSIRLKLYAVNDEFYIISYLEQAVFSLFDSILCRDTDTNDSGLTLFSDDLSNVEELMACKMGKFGEQYKSMWTVRYAVALFNIFVILYSYSDIDFEPVWELLKSKIANYYDADYLTICNKVEEVKLEVVSWDKVHSALLNYCPSSLS